MTELSNVTAENVHQGDHPGAARGGTNQVTVTDAIGRKIEIRKLGALDRLRLFEMLGGELSMNVQYLSYALTVACVRTIDNQPVAFPSAKKAIEQLVLRLGDDGIEAVSDAYRNHFSAGETGDLASIKN